MRLPATIIADALEHDLAEEVSAPTLRRLCELSAESIVVALVNEGYVIRPDDGKSDD